MKDKMQNAVILGSGMYVPDKVVPNSFFNDILGEDVDTWLRDNLTIRERRWCTEKESTSTLVLEAAKRILADSNTTPEELDLIIVATDTPEFISPSTASILQFEIGASKAGTFDLNTACAGFVTALDVASKFIKADPKYKKILVIGAYAMSKYLDLYDKKTVTLFADGAAGVVLGAAETTDQGWQTSTLFTEGQYNGYMGIYAGGTNTPLTPELVSQKEHLLKFVKKFPKELNQEKWSQMVIDMTASIGLTPKDVNHFFLTQININSIWATLDILGVDRDKAPTVMDEYGYTGSACIPMAFHKAVKSGIVKKGDVCVFIGSGGGLAFAGTIFKY